MADELTADFVDSLRLASRKLTGFRRRQFQAEMALKYCGGSPRKAERMFGWGRDTVHTGLNELRTGIRCIERTSSRGRKKTEAQHPALAQKIRELVEPHAQADPKFQTTLAYTRLTAKHVRQALLQEESLKEVVPSRQTVGEMLNRLGYCLRRVRKTQPEKKFPRPTRSSPRSMPRVGVLSASRIR